MKYFKEYLGLVLLVIAVIAAEPLMSAFYEFTATEKKEGFAADRVPSGEYPREVDEPLLYAVVSHVSQEGRSRIRSRPPRE
jgi:hypothetical protein